MDPGDSNPLCLKCGLCCNGAIFADVQLQPGDGADRLAALGLAFVPTRRAGPRTPKFLQPCAAFDGCHCRIYIDRPEYCRGFECLLLKRVRAGRMGTAAALAVIRRARRRVEKVKQLLRELGDDDEQLALSRRFQRLQQRLKSGDSNEATAALFGRLTLAVHDLNVLLSEAFYPGRGS